MVTENNKKLQKMVFECRKFTQNNGVANVLVKSGRVEAKCCDTSADLIWFNEKALCFE